MKRRSGFIMVGGASALSLITSSAFGAFTTVNSPFPGEDSHSEILSEVYGGTFVADGEGFSNGSITAERIDDDFDQEFTSESGFSARAIATFALFEQEFGYIDDGGFQSLFDVGGDEYAVTGDADASVDGVFKFARNGTQGILASSNPEDNPDDADHLVTYRLTGQGIDGDLLVLFFEDRRDFDFDFQDLVVEVKGAQNFIIPTPAAFAAGLAMMGISAVRRRRTA